MKKTMAKAMKANTPQLSATSWEKLAKMSENSIVLGETTRSAPKSPKYEDVKATASSFDSGKSSKPVESISLFRLLALLDAKPILKW